MNIMGLDPGTVSTGWAILKKDASTLMAHGEIKFSAKQSVPCKLVHLYQQLLNIFSIYTPHTLVIEKIFMRYNPQALFTLSYARGVILMAAASEKIAIVECTPSSAKKALTGYGHASKEQVQASIQSYFGQSLPCDSADAAALAFYYTSVHSFNEKMGIG